MDLSGTWRAAVADDDLRRGALGLDYDDDGWEAVPVPGHWRSTPAFAEHDGPAALPDPLRARRRARPGARHWVVLDGVFYQADVFLDGAYLGDPEGYFFPHSYEITDLARLAPEHVLAVEVACTPPAGPPGQAQPHRRLPALGLHRPRPGTRAGSGGGVRIERDRARCASTGMRVLCRDAEPARANVMVRAELDSDEPRTVRIRTTLDGERRARAGALAGQGRRTPSSGPSASTTRELWWPRALGRPAAGPRSRSR